MFQRAIKNANILIKVDFSQQTVVNGLHGHNALCHVEKVLNTGRQSASWTLVPI